MTETSSPSLQLQLNDHVFVQHTSIKDGDGVNQLEGSISYIGPVPELRSSSLTGGGESEPISSENDIYYGIRLTGSSVGMGINYDTIIEFQQLQERYFACPIDSALFVRATTAANVITKRTLSKLEALRIRRELASSGTTVASTSSKIPTTTSTPSRESSIPMKTAVSSTPAPAGSNAMARLEELRLRREALKAWAAVL